LQSINREVPVVWLLVEEAPTVDLLKLIGTKYARLSLLFMFGPLDCIHVAIGICTFIPSLLLLECKDEPAGACKPFDAPLDPVQRYITRWCNA
jgi:hypothetical protein